MIIFTQAFTAAVYEPAPPRFLIYDSYFVDILSSPPRLEPASYNIEGGSLFKGLL